MTLNDWTLDRVLVVLPGGRRIEFRDPATAAVCAATLTRCGVSVRVLFRFHDGSTAEVSHPVQSAGIQTSIDTSEWLQ